MSIDISSFWHFEFRFIVVVIVKSYKIEWPNYLGKHISFTPKPKQLTALECDGENFLGTHDCNKRL